MSGQAGARESALPYQSMRYHRQVVGASAAAALVAAAFLPLEHATGQTAGSPSAEWVVEREVSDRWLHGRQLPRFVPYRRNREWLFVDFEPALAAFYIDGCGFRSTHAGLVHLPTWQPSRS